jgi:hypothetical protein
MFLNDEDAINEIRARKDGEMFWIAVTAVVAFVVMFSGMLSNI